MANLDFNIEPYFDDFDDSKHFHKILFKPGYAVQARELTQLQSIIQSQIDKFGSHIFKDGSVVHNGDHSAVYTKAIPIKSFSGTIVLADFLGKIVYIGTTRKLIVHTEVINSVNYIFTVDKTDGIISENTTLTVEGNVTFTLLVESSDNFAVYTDYILHKILKGVYFISGYFTTVEEQTILVSGDNTANIDVYLEAIESIITYSEDESLLDNAAGSPNYSAPGADRYCIELTLTSTHAGETLDTSNKHFLLASYRNGTIVVDIDKPAYSDLEKHLAERTYNESGDYTVMPFMGKVVPETTYTTDYSVKLDKGLAYIQGFEFSTKEQTTLTAPKARTTSSVNNAQIILDKGPYVVVENLFGLIFPYSTRTTIDIHSNLTTAGVDAGVNLTSATTYNTTKIGTATALYTINSGVTGTYKLFLTDISMFTGKSFANAKSFIVKTGTGPYAKQFSADFSNEEYTAAVSVYNSQNYSQLFKLPNTPVKTHLSTNNLTDISYQSYKEFLYVSFAAVSSMSQGSFTLTSPQSFIGSGLLSASTISQHWYARVVSAGGSGYTVGQIVPITDIASVNISSPTSATVRINKNTNMTIDVFVVVSNSLTSTRNKTLTNGSKVISGVISGVTIDDTSISLNTADGYELISVMDDQGGDQTDLYNLYSGQKDAYYDHAYIKLKNPNITPRSTNQRITSLTVSFKYFSHTGVGPITVDSYSTALSYDQIPSYKVASGDIFRLSDVLDFRPRRTDNSTTFDAFHLPIFDSLLTTDYEFYLPRTDRIVVTPDLNLSIVQGVPAKFPLIPSVGDSLTLYIVSIPAYTFSADDITIEYIDNRRYTMKDIAKIDKRVNRLEYYSTLSLLEKQASDESVASDVPGMDKFKNGILVDAFAGHSVGDVYNPDYNCAIDFNTRILRPAFDSNSYGYNVVDNSIINIDISRDLATLDFTESPVVIQMIASEAESVQPFGVFNWNGIMAMDPPTDVWIDTVTKPEVTVNLNGEHDAYSVFATGNGQSWSNWETTGKGVTDLALQSNVSVRSNVTIINQ
jgi:hypothetical protein